MYHHSKPGQLDWIDELQPDEKVVCQSETLSECYEMLCKETEGSRWCLYPSCYIEHEEGGEVWESTCVYDKCKSCGHDSYDYITTGETSD